MPRNAATCSAVLNCFNPSNVARTMLIGVLVPKDLDKMSLTPASSKIERTAPR